MEKSIDEIISSNKGLVYSTLIEYNMLNDSEAESTSFLALWSAARTYDPNHESGAQFSTYAVRCIKNALGTYLRKLNRKRQLETVPLQDFTQSLESQDALDVLLQNEDSAKIQAALANLRNSFTNPTYTRIFDAWEEGGFELSKVNIAQQSGVSQPYVTQTIAVFKHKIRQYLKEDYYG